MATFLLFIELPIELQVLILSYDCIKQSQYLSKRIKDNTFNLFIDKYITQNPTNNELTNYLNTLPTTYFVLGYKLNNTLIRGYIQYYHLCTEYSMVHFQTEYKLLRAIEFILRDDNTNDIKSIFTEESKSEDKDVNIYQLVNDKQQDIKNLFMIDVDKFYDIDTINYILETRLNSYELNDEEINRLRLKYLLLYFDFAINLLDIKYIPSSFLYLYFNAQLLNIKTTHGTKFICGINIFVNNYSRSDKGISSVKNYCDVLYGQIVKRVNLLYT